MKKILLVILFISIITAVCIPLILKNKQDKTVTNEQPSNLKHLKRPNKPFIVNDSAVVKIRDIKGADVSFYTFNSVCNEIYDGLNYQGDALSGIFAEQKVLPIQKSSGLISLIFIEEIDEYFFDGENATIILKDGSLIKGFPVKDYEILGRSRLGDISVPMLNINYAKFNKKIPEDIYRKSKDKLKQHFNISGNYINWPDDIKESIELITYSNDSDIINAPIFVYNESGCDDNWIPCKSYTVWRLSNFVPVKNGTFIVKINIQQIKFAEIKIKKENNRNEHYINFTLRNNEQLTNVLLYNGSGGFGNEYDTNVGMLGLMKHGIAFLPIDKIKEIYCK